MSSGDNIDRRLFYVVGTMYSSNVFEGRIPPKWTSIAMSVIAFMFDVFTTDNISDPLQVAHAISIEESVKQFLSLHGGTEMPHGLCKWSMQSVL